MPGHRVTAAGLAKIARGQWGIESVHWLRDTACAEDASAGYAENGPQVMAAFRSVNPSPGHVGFDGKRPGRETAGALAFLR